MIKGLYQNTNPENVPKQYAWYAKNVVTNRLLDSCINEKGNSILLSGFETYNISFFIGVAVYGDDIIFAYKTNDNHDQILVYNQITDVKTIKLDRTDFNFNQDYPLDIEVKYNHKNNIIVVLTDNLNPPRYVNLEDTNRVLTYYNLFPIYYNPSDIQTEVIDSGSLLSGAYFIYIQYITSDRTRTQYSLGSNPTYVNDENKGLASNLSTNKSIRVDLKNVDTTYSKVAIVVLSKIGLVTSAKVVREINIGSSTDLRFTYSGNEFLYDISIDDLLEIQPVYIKAKHVASINDQLLLAELEADEIIDYQELANLTVIDWISELDTTNRVASTTKYKLGNKKSYIHDEVYALYQQFELEGGRLTDWYHIPGRDLTEVELGEATATIDGLQINGRTPKLYELQDTAGQPKELSPTVDGIISKFGTMGGWENSNEKYPNTERWVIRDSDDNIIRDLRGTNVKHHKFPSIGFLAEEAYSTEAGYGINCIDRLGIKISNPKIFTSEYPKVKGYRIGYAKRNLSDVSVVGFGLTMLSGSPSTADGISADTNIITSSAGNFNINCLNADPDNTPINKNYLRFNSFDIWQDRPALNGVYLRNYVKLIANALSDLHASYNGIPNVNNDYGMIFPGTGTFNMVAYASNFTVQGEFNTTKEFVANTNIIRRLTDPIYVPNNIKINQNSIVIDNAGKEEIVFAKIEGDPVDIDTIGQLNVHTNNSTTDAAMGEETFLAALKNPKSDFFLDFENQNIVTNPTIFRTSTATTSDTSAQEILTNGNFFSNLTGWSQVGAGTSWVDYLGKAEVTLAGFGAVSKTLYQAGIIEGNTYQIQLEVTKPGFPNSALLRLKFLDAGDIELSSEIIADIVNITRIAPPGATKIGFKVDTGVDPGYITIDNVSVLDITPGAIQTYNPLFAGDGFIGVYSYVMIAPYNKNVDINASETERIVNFKMHINIGRHNSNLRYQTLGDYSTYFYPDGGKFNLADNEVDKYWFYAHPRKSAWNDFNYSKDFSALQDIETYDIFNPEALNESSFPYRTIRSTKASRDNSLEDGWRSFKPIDYYDTIKNKGPINNLESWGDILLIHHRDALFRTRDKAVLQTNESLPVQLGSGDLFDIEPQEQNPTKNGYAGTQHKFACIVSDIGYIFPDASRGEIFLFNGQLTNITKGYRLFFQKYLQSTKDNPLNDDGISIAYDQQNALILLSLKASTNNFVISFDTIKQEWNSFHDITNSYLFNSKNKFYSIKYNDTKRDVYLHGNGKHGEFYGVIKSSFIDFIINDAPDKNKVLSSIQWFSKLYVNNILELRKTITHITVYNDLYTTGRIAITTNETESLFNDLNINTKIVDELWSFDDIYNKATSTDFLSSIFDDYQIKPTSLNEDPKWFEAEPIRGKYFIIRLEYDNLEDNEINIFGINALMRLSKS